MGYSLRLKTDTLSNNSAIKLNYSIAWILWAVPIVLSIGYVYLFGVNIPWADQFYFIPLLEKGFWGALSSPEFYAQHNEHKIYFPRAVMLISAVLTRYNVKVEMFFTQFFLLASLGVITLELRKHFKLRETLLWLVPVPFLIFSLRQHANMLLGFQLSLVSALLFSLLTLFLIYLLNENYSRKRFIIFWGAVISAIFATFSVAGGLVVWPVVFLEILFLRLTWPIKKWYFIIWIILSLLVCFFYFYDYQKPAHHPSLLFAVEHPEAAITYFFATIGGSLFWHYDLALITGVILFIISLVTLYILYRENRVNENLFWISVMILAYTTIVLGSISRSGLGVSNAMASKYTTFSIPLVLAQFVMLLDLFIYRRRDIFAMSLGFVLSLIILGMFTSYFQAYEYGRYEYMARSNMTFIWFDYQNQPDKILAKTRAQPFWVKKDASTLQKLNYNIFSNPQKYGVPDFSELALQPTKPLFKLDTVNSNILNYGNSDIVEHRESLPSIVVNNNSDFIMLTGWAVDPVNQDTASRVYFEIGNKVYPASYGLERRDIADKFGIPSYRFSGFEIGIPTSTINAGRQNLSIRILSADGRSYYEHKQPIFIEKSEQQLVIKIEA